MSRAKIILVFLLLILAAGCDKRSPFTNYTECTKQKKVEYIDAGASAYDGESRAVAFCETKYPLLQPSYQTVHGVSVRVEHNPGCGLDVCEQYEFHLNQSVDLVTIAITIQGGQTGLFTKVTPYNGKITWKPGKQENWEQAKQEITVTGDSSLVRNEQAKWNEEQMSANKRAMEEVLTDPSVPVEQRKAVMEAYVQTTVEYVSGGMKDLRNKLLIEKAIREVSPVVSAEVVEAWVDFNKGKHQGD